MARVDTDETNEAVAVEPTTEAQNTQNTQNTENATVDSSANGSAPSSTTEAPAQPATPEAPAGPTEEELQALVKAFTDEVAAVLVDENRHPETGALPEALTGRVRAKFAE